MSCQVFYVLYVISECHTFMPYPVLHIFMSCHVFHIMSSIYTPCCLSMPVFFFYVLYFMSIYFMSFILCPICHMSNMMPCTDLLLGFKDDLSPCSGIGFCQNLLKRTNMEWITKYRRGKSNPLFISTQKIDRHASAQEASKVYQTRVLQGQFHNCIYTSKQGPHSNKVLRFWSRIQLYHVWSCSLLSVDFYQIFKR